MKPPVAAAVAAPKPVIAQPSEGNVPEAAPSPASEASGAKEGHLVDSTIRVDVKLLIKLMNLVGELVLARNQLLQDTSEQKLVAATDFATAEPDIDELERAASE